MLLAPNARDNLMTLLRLAREEAEDLRADLSDVELAMAAASSSLALLENEDLISFSDSAEASELERLRARRHRLFTTREMLDRAAEEARQKLEAATSELKKLERLVAIGADATRSDVRLTSGPPRAGAFVSERKLASWAETFPHEIGKIHPLLTDIYRSSAVASLGLFCFCSVITGEFRRPSAIQPLTAHKIPCYPINARNLPG